MEFKAVLVKSFARIHRANLINNGILPLLFTQSEDYDLLTPGSILGVINLRDSLLGGGEKLTLKLDENQTVEVLLQASDFERKVLAAGGKINLLKNQGT